VLLACAITLVVIQFAKGDETLHFLREAQPGLRGMDLRGKLARLRLERNAVLLAPFAGALNAEIDGFGEAVPTEVDQIMKRDVGFQLLDFDVPGVFASLARGDRG